MDADLREGDAEHLPFDDASSDTAVCALALCTIPRPAAAIAEMRRVLIPGGRLLLDHIGGTWPPVYAVQWLMERIAIRAAGEYFTRQDRSTCSIGWPIPRSVASEKAATSSASRTPEP